MKKITIAFSLLFSQFFFAQDGVADTTFGTNGVVVLSDANTTYYPELLQDGKILYQKNNIIKRLMANGQADAAFGASGQITLNQLGTDGYYNLLVQGDKILAFTGDELGWPGGWEFFGGRYNADGTLDTTFGQNGTIEISMDEVEGGIYTTFLNGDLIVSGNTVSNYGSYNNIVARKISMVDGSSMSWSGQGGLSNGFNLSSSSQGYSTYDGAGKSLILPNGDYILQVRAAYYSTTGFDYARSGYVRVRPGVNTPQTTINSFNAYYGGVNADIYADADSNVYSLSGSPTSSSNTSNPTNIIYKRNSEGNLYNAFGNSGALSLSLLANGLKVDFKQLVVQPDGKIIVAGVTTTTQSAYQNENVIMARFLVTGELDTTFGTNGYVSYSVPNPTTSSWGNSVRGLYLSPDASTLYLMASNGENSVILKYTNNSFVVPTAPEFTQVAAICSGETLEALPTTSQNGVTGTWAPALNNTATTTYTFTPASGQNASTTTMTITVNQPSSSWTDVLNCGSYMWNANGTTYTQSGTYTNVTTNAAGCTHTATLALTITAAEAVTGESAQTITVTAGNDATIAAIVVNATDVIWYASEADALAHENPIPTETVITDGNTYYAVNTNDWGCFSSPFAVTVTVEVELSNSDFDASDFSLYPNPTNGLVVIKNTRGISSVAVFNLLGQQLISQKTDATEAMIDLSALNSGTYFVKVTADNQIRTVKVLKK
ncbi:T9SS type A sorting domain-containing protein [Flavobacterium silvaticum]|uniref:T9SS type A sorting domain-containing protein n=1 Tax=Flavobacterium silvaticum TaxID=1852020 RepID=A0A972FMW5_9FLAO|nr:T9SS type A sorting domain-containing protein [Flavobacterium silvaticum]NMH28638.1 T9SS type A sorting domain-containing protein [Flavobacterium silvaticum]